MSVATAATPGAAPRRSERMSLAYLGLLFFMVVSYARPSDWIPGAAGVPFAKIAAFFLLTGFAVGVIRAQGRALAAAKEMLPLLLLYGQFCLAVPFSIWRRGSFELVFFDLWKLVLITIVVVFAVRSLEQLRRLLFVQAAGLAMMAALAAWNYRHSDHPGGRLSGVVGGVFGNSNELALGIALSFPLCFAFLLAARNPLKKAIWAIGMAAMSYALLLTYSRSGLLSLVTAVAVCLWEFGLKGRRRYLLVVVLIGALAFLVFGRPAHYGDRVATIFDPDEDPTGSAQQRHELLQRSLEVTLEHPLFGAGPGMFAILSGNWHGAHNTYTELSSEAGLPALFLFLLLLWRAFRNIGRAQRLAGGQAQFRLLASALRASLAGFVVGAFFYDAAYHYFPYFLAAFACVAHQIASASETGQPRSSAAQEALSFRMQVEEREPEWVEPRTARLEPSLERYLPKA